MASYPKYNDILGTGGWLSRVAPDPTRRLTAEELRANAEYYRADRRRRHRREVVAPIDPSIDFGLGSTQPSTR